jgi:ATP phosphoribosyltransferase regulatory subunit
MIRYDRITPEGTRDILFDECEAQNGIINRLRGIFEEKQYREVMTPGFEFYDVFSSNAAYYPQESMYKLADNRGRLLTLRPDSTIPIARMTATKLKGHALPLRVYYAQRVFRQQPELRGRRSEIMQMGIELIGASGFEADVEVLTAAVDALAACSASHFRIELGHVGIFNKLIADLEAEPAEKERIHRYIASKNYAALGDVLEGARQDKTAEILKELPRLFGGAEALEEARRLFSGYGGDLPVMLEHLERIYRVLARLDFGDQIMVDFGLVNQAEYYSSLVFKGYVASSGDAVLSGGRYDGLFRDFGENLPATGFALNVDALTAGLLQAEPEARGAADGTVSAAADGAPGLRIALTKGRLEKDLVGMMEAAGYDVSLLRDKGRKLLLPIPGTKLQVVLAKAADVITYVEHGVCDVGVVGKDTIAEQGGVYYEIMDLGVGLCRFALAAPMGQDFYGGFGARRIATKYPGVAAAWFESKGMDVQIIKIEGSVELAPLLSLADGIVDIVETGSTLRENGLEIIEEIRPVSARMIVNVAAMKLKKAEIDAFAAALQTAREGADEA